jgi:hypothetical protein
MTAEEEIKKKLEELAKAIPPDETLVKNVMGSIAAKPIGESSRISKSKNKLIIRRFIMSRFTRFAAAAVVILVVVFGMTFLNRSSKPAFGMTDMLEFISQARTLHIRGWRVQRYGTPPKELKLPFEYWYDLENGRYRSNYSMKLSDNNEIDHSSDICDGQYIMSEGRYIMSEGQYIISEGGYKPTGNRVHKTINFEKVDPAKRINIKWLDWYRKLVQIEGFHKIGQEAIGGERFDIWEGEYNSGVGDNIDRVRLQTWLSPATAQVGRSKTWRKKDNEDWIQVSEYTTIERNVFLPEGIFKTEPPAGHEIKTAKEDATVPVRQQRDIYEHTQFGYAPLSYWVEPVFHLKDGSLLACWESVDAKESRDQSGYFQGLSVGGDLPKLPTEIFALSPEPNVRGVQFIGYHLAYTLKETEKGKRWYEWSLYIPDKEPPPVNAVLDYRIHYRLNVNRTKDIDNSVKQIAIPDPIHVETEDDFNIFVLGAMAERSDGGLVPEYVNYENILRLANQLRKSPTQ